MSPATAFSLTDAEQRRIERIDRLVALGASSVGELVASISDTSWTVRRAAVGALAALGDDAVPALCAWLQSSRTSEHAIAAAVDALAASLGLDVSSSVTPLLADPNPAVVADAAVILGRRRATEATPHLSRLLEHADDNVAVAAIEGLGRIGGTVAVDALIRVIGQRNFFRTFAAIQVISSIRDPRVVLPLAELLGDESFRIDAARALGRTGSVFAITPIASLLTLPGRDAVCLVANALSDLLARAEWSGATAAVSAAMRTVIAPERRVFIDELHRASSADRIAIARVLGTIGDASTLPSLVTLIDDVDVGAAVLTAIEQIALLHADALIEALASGTTGTRTALLPMVRSTRAAVVVRGLLDDDEPEVRARACDALARIGDTDSVPRLFETLADESPRVSYAAMAAINSLGSGLTATLAIQALQTGPTDVRRHALRIIAYLGSREAFDAVHSAVDDRDRRIAELALSALGVLEDTRVDEILISVARRPDEALRAAVMRAAGQRGGERMTELLCRGLSDDVAWVRYYACQGLGRIAHVASTQLIIGRLADAYPHVRIAAIEALARLDGPQAWQALSSAVRSSDPDEQRAALVGISRIPRPATLPLLVEAARSPDVATRLIALAGLARMPEPSALSHLVAAARGNVAELRDAAVSLLADRSDRAAADALVEIVVATDVDHPSQRALSHASATRIEAIVDHLASANDQAAIVLTAALARMADPNATAALFDALAAPSADARRGAAAALMATNAEGARAAVDRLASEDPDPDVRRACKAAVDGVSSTASSER